MRRWMKTVLAEAGRTDRDKAFVWTRRHRAPSVRPEAGRVDATG